ncbi:hypothetical protein C8Q74DRAFT_1213753 [Fomes fomentarius]|nr:hypothetical protein C8Q74DRAFT_1222188 [Fomes fomentarius]KAI0808025.1 hypothetical protein C8Q74DRAFT_1213753 [Fomes fomentarius]
MRINGVPQLLPSMTHSTPSDKEFILSTVVSAFIALLRHLVTSGTPETPEQNQISILADTSSYIHCCITSLAKLTSSGGSYMCRTMVETATTHLSSVHSLASEIAVAGVPGGRSRRREGGMEVVMLRAWLSLYLKPAALSGLAPAMRVAWSGNNGRRPLKTAGLTPRSPGTRLYLRTKRVLYIRERVFASPVKQHMFCEEQVYNAARRQCANEGIPKLVHHLDITAVWRTRSQKSYTRRLSPLDIETHVGLRRNLKAYPILSDELLVYHCREGLVLTLNFEMRYLILMFPLACPSFITQGYSGYCPPGANISIACAADIYVYIYLGRGVPPTSHRTYSQTVYHTYPLHQTQDYLMDPLSMLFLIATPDRKTYEHHPGHACYVRLKVSLEDSSYDADSIPGPEAQQAASLRLCPDYYPSASTPTAPTEPLSSTVGASKQGAAGIHAVLPPVHEDARTEPKLRRKGNKVEEPFTVMKYDNTCMKDAANGEVMDSEEDTFDHGKFRTKEGGQVHSPPLRWLARIIAEEVERALALSGYRLHLLDGTWIEYDDIVLDDVKCVSQGSVQPSLRYYPRGA